MEDMTPETDGELWRRAAAGEAECFGVLFDRHAERVRTYCARRTGSFDAADDLVSIVFLEAWRRRSEVELVKASALPWLYGIANHAVQRRFRTALRHRSALARLPEAHGVPDHADPVTARLDDERHLARLKVALGGLRRRDQEVLLLCVPGTGLCIRRRVVLDRRGTVMTRPLSPMSSERHHAIRSLLVAEAAARDRSRLHQPLLGSSSGQHHGAWQSSHCAQHQWPSSPPPWS